jgi:oligopeptide/dipeptide ABC transporter ATP-binding protein
VIAPQLDARHLTKVFPLRRGFFARNRARLYAVDDVSFAIGRGETLGLVGESGCGKTTTAKLLVRLLAPTSGQILFRLGDDEPIELGSLRGGAAKTFRRNAQIVFQDPYESLDPRMKALDIVAEPLAIEGSADAGERRARAAEMLHTVGLDPAAALGLRFPHELSGGQRQRVAIARALILQPAFLAADEPTSMLDASIRAGIMNLLLELSGRLQLASLFITHHLAVARYMSQRLAVMYLGKIVEIGATEELLAHPLHPYTRALLSAVPEADPRARRAPPEILGGVGSPVDPPPHCRFLPRCPIAANVCRTRPHPELEEKSAGHRAACHLV